MHPERDTVVIACRADIRRRLTLDGGRTTIRFIELEEGRYAWDLPPEADVLVTASSDWKSAPKEPPPGWSKNLTWVHALSAGIDAYAPWIFDVPEPTCGRGSSSVAIAEYVMAAILHHEKRLAQIWVDDPLKWKKVEIGRIAGRSIGLFGIGAIGMEVAKRALAFDARVIALRRTAKPMPVENIQSAATLDELVARVDHLVIAAPLTPETRHVVNAGSLAKARHGLHIVNISRGALIHDDDLMDAIDKGIVSAATLDVTSPEPLPAGHPFYSDPRIRLTPHISWYSEDADDRMSDSLQANLDRYIRRQPLVNRVDVRQGY